MKVSLIFILTVQVTLSLYNKYLLIQLFSQSTPVTYKINKCIIIYLSLFNRFTGPPLDFYPSSLYSLGNTLFFQNISNSPFLLIFRNLTPFNLRAFPICFYQFPNLPLPHLPICLSQFPTLSLHNFHSPLRSHLVSRKSQQCLHTWTHNML